MTCGCNDKCELPKALQINNPGEVTLFHRVDIPASQGDDTTYPPKNGLYRNVLLVYLANNHSYLYNSDGIPTRVDGPKGPEGPGVAPGGETGQVLAKNSDSDYDTTWVTQTSANDAKLTLTRNNTEIGDFTANASVDKTIDIEVPTKTSDLINDGATGESTYAEATDIADIWEEIEEIEAASDVTDVVGTYAELEDYDTSKLKDNDIIKVLEDETQNDQITYYRWDTDTETFTLIGAIGPYYTKSEADSEFVPQTRTVNSKALSSNITLTASDVGALPDSTIIPTVNDATLTITQNGTSAGTFTANSATDTTIALTDTTYSDFTGATSSVAGSHGLVPAPTTSDPDKFLKGDGTWGTPPGTTYTEGTGIDITGSTISVDTSTVAMQSDLPTKTSDLINDGSDNTSTYVEADELATVATSGSYNDLLNKPTIPTVNDATLTIQKNGTTVETFTANSSTDKTANITVPTKTSDLTNDGADGTSTYVEADELAPGYITGEGTDITLPNTQGGRLSDVKLKGDTVQGIALPDGYQQVEYVGSAGGSSGAYINSGVKSSNTIKVVATAALTSGVLFGEGLQGNWVNIGVLNASGVYRGRARTSASGNTDVTSTVATGSTFHTLELSQSDGFWIDGTKIGTFASYTYTSNNTIYIHAWQNGSGAVDRAVAQIKDFKIYDDSTLVKWFVPCKRISDSVAGYYEMVEGSFNPSASGTAFTAGSATPTPSTPQTVQTVTGEQTITISDGDQQSQTYTINLGKNLLDTTVTQPGFINSSGNYQANANSQASVYIEVLPNTTYTASATATYRYIGFAEYTSAKTFIGSIQQGGDTSSYSITTTAATKFIRVFYNKSTNITAQTLRDDKAQIEIGSARTDYILYADKVELCKIGDYQDYIYKNNGTWYLHKETGRANITSFAERWPASSNYRFRLATPSGALVPLDTTSGGAGYCNMATLGIQGSTFTQANTWTMSSTDLLFNLDAIATMSLADANTWLASNPLSIYYPLATPTDTPITGTLLDDLNAFDQATSYNGDTHITVASVSPDLPAILSVAVEQESALPVATETSVGVVSVGDGLSITEGGVLSALGGMTLVKTLANSDITAHSGTMASEAIRGSVYKTNDGKIGILYITQIRFDSASTGWLTVTFKTGLTFTSPGDVAIPMGFVWNYSANGSNLSASNFSITSLNADGTITAKAYNDVASTNLRWWGAGAVLLKLD